MLCEHCRGTGLDPATTPAMNVKCQHCVGGQKQSIGNIKITGDVGSIDLDVYVDKKVKEEYVEDKNGDIKPVYVIRSNKK